MSRSYKARKTYKDKEYQERYEKSVNKKKEERRLRESRKQAHYQESSDG